ncbi:hypothetical protein HHI36_023908 [Cryptolaemus montrouzieri]|uniref:Uncharacterized protein n=1 Tax=Cryptolaemus montrouzieri TaxID=559131 RepID=A0ABD2N0V4_9CUCU
MFVKSINKSTKLGILGSTKDYLERLITGFSLTINDSIDALETGLKEHFVKVKTDTEEKFKEYEERIEKLVDENRKLRDQLANLNKKQMKNNLIIHGASLVNKNPGETAVNIFRDAINASVESGDLNDAYALGKNHKILVEFISSNKRQ